MILFSVLLGQTMIVPVSYYKTYKMHVNMHRTGTVSKILQKNTGIEDYSGKVILVIRFTRLPTHKDKLMPIVWLR